MNPMEFSGMPRDFAGGPGGFPGGFPGAPGMPGMPGFGGPSRNSAAAPATPAITPGDPTAPLVYEYERSVTGRVSNPLFDVAYFRAVVHVDFTRLDQFLQQIGDDRLVYIRNLQITSLDPASLQLDGFIYGDVPVVEVTLDMEMLFMRSWTTPSIPDVVRVTLGIPPHDPNATSATGATGQMN